MYTTRTCPFCKMQKDYLNSKNITFSEILVDETNYANKALELARNFEEMSEEIYLTYRKEEENLSGCLLLCCWLYQE